MFIENTPSVERLARRFVEYTYEFGNILMLWTRRFSAAHDFIKLTKMKPCISSSLKSVALWYEESMTSTLRFESPS